MKKVFWLVSFALAAAASTGCVAVTSAPSTAGKVWIVKHQLIGSDVIYQCEANGGNPVCKEQDMQ